MNGRLLVAGAVVAGVVALVAGPAFAHAEIEREGQVGSDGMVEATLSVPNEEPDAGTLKIELVFPDTPAITDAQAGEVDGWTATVEKSVGGEVESVTWTGGPITGENRVELPLTLGPVPEDTEEVDFTALQTYDNGDVVRWVEPTAEGGEEPEHPAPVLLVSGEASAHDESDANHDDGLSTAAIVGIVAGVIIVVALIVWLVRRRRAGASTT